MKKETGFTLIELMVTVVVMAIVIAYAVPSMNSVIKNNRLTTRANEFVTAIQLARSEAVKRGDVINIIAAGGDWNAGWTVETSGGTIIRTFEALPPGTTLTSTGGLVSFQYQGTGMIDNADVLDLCDDRVNENGREITITATGRISIGGFACP